MNRRDRRAAKARGTGVATPLLSTAAKSLSPDGQEYVRAIVKLGHVMEAWLRRNPDAKLEWHRLMQPPAGVPTSSPEGLDVLAKSPDARRMLLESDRVFARVAGGGSLVYMARTALALVEQLPHLDSN